MNDSYNLSVTACNWATSNHQPSRRASKLWQQQRQRRRWRHCTTSKRYESTMAREINVGRYYNGSEKQRRRLILLSYTRAHMCVLWLGAAAMVLILLHSSTISVTTIVTTTLLLVPVEEYESYATPSHSRVVVVVHCATHETSTAPNRKNFLSSSFSL